MRNFLVSGLVAFLAGVGIGVMFAERLAPSRDVALEDRFLDECQWSPAVKQPDGSTTARQPRNPFPLCYIELVKAKSINTSITMPTLAPTPVAPAAPAAPAAPTGAKP